MNISFLGTTSLLFDDGENKILFDAHVTRPSVFKMLFTKLEPDEGVVDDIISKFDIQNVSALFISHSHYDHILDGPSFIKKTGGKVYGSKSTAMVFEGAGIDKETINIFDFNTDYIIGNFKIRVLKSKHSKAHWYNNDLGQEITEPLIQPARKKDYKEGGSFDFYIENSGVSYLIRPSYNYVEGELDDINADIVFLGTAGLSNAKIDEQNVFFNETLEKVKPKKVIPIHWDNFLRSINKPVKGMPTFIENTYASLNILKNYCDDNDIEMIIMNPLTSIDV